MMTFEWPNTTPVTMVCLKKWFETDDTVSLQIAPKNNDASFDFKPGQFISLGLPIEKSNPSKIDYRAYSISSIPGQVYLQLTIKRVENGAVSNYIVDSLKEGDEVQVLKPAGIFNTVDHAPKRNTERQKVVLISAGCGITPVMSMAKTWLSDEQASTVDIDFVHMAKSPLQTIYFSELEQMDEEHANFNLKLLLKDSQTTRHPQGRLDAQWLQQLCSDILERTVYLCGPVSFMQDMENNLKEMGFDMAHFHQESFTPTAEESNQEEAVVEQQASGAVSIHVPDFGASLEAEHGAPLIDALEGAGLPIIAACRSGICGSCKCKVNKGEVRSTSQETLTPEEIEQGYVLACSSQVHSDVEVSLN